LLLLLLLLLLLFFDFPYASYETYGATGLKVADEKGPDSPEAKKWLRGGPFIVDLDHSGAEYHREGVGVLSTLVIRGGRGQPPPGNHNPFCNIVSIFGILIPDEVRRTPYSYSFRECDAISVSSPRVDSWVGSSLHPILR
jgi:hypothetical protein